MNRSYSCVPRGNRRSTYSAPTIASRNDLRLRLSVDTNTAPPGLTSRPSSRNECLRIGQVLQHFHAAHDVEMMGTAPRPAAARPGRDSRWQGPIRRHAAARSRSWPATGRWPVTMRAATGQRLGQQAAAAADIQHAGAWQRRARRDVIGAHRVQMMQRAELALADPRSDAPVPRTWRFRPDRRLIFSALFTGASIPSQSLMQARFGALPVLEFGV